MNKTIIKYFLVTSLAMIIATVALFYVFSFLNVNFTVILAWIIPIYFIAITATSAFLVSKKLNEKKDLSIGFILGIRFIFFFLILLFVFINMWLDKERIIGVTIVSVILTIVFLIFETKLLLLKNRIDKVKELE